LKLKYLKYFLLCLSISANSFSQNRTIDSLLNLIKTGKDDTVKVKNLYTLSTEQSDVGDYKAALTTCGEAVLLAQKLNWKRGKALAFNNMGVIYSDDGDYDRALDCYLKALHIREELDDKIGIALSYNNIGLIYKGQMNYSSAAMYYQRSLAIFYEFDKSEPGNIKVEKGIGRTYNNLGNLFYTQGNLDSALFYHLRSLELAQKHKEKSSVGISLNNIGLIYFDRHEFEKALDFHTRSLAIKEETDDRLGAGYSYFNMANTYKEIAANSFSETKSKQKYAEAETMYIKAEEIFKENDYRIGLQEIYDEMADLFAKEKNFEKAYAFHLLSSDLKDSLLNTESNSQIAKLQAEYETNKRENKISVLNKDKELQNAQLNKQKVIIWGAILGLILVLGFSVYVFRSLRITKRQKAIIEEQKSLVDSKQKEILDSIIYAKHIQQSLMPSDKYIERNLNKLNKK